MKSFLLLLALATSITILGCGSKKSLNGVWRSVQAPSSEVGSAMLIFGEGGKFEVSLKVKHPSANLDTVIGMGTYTANPDLTSITTSSLTVGASTSRLSPDLEEVAKQYVQPFAGQMTIAWKSEKELTLQNADQAITFRKD